MIMESAAFLAEQQEAERGRRSSRRSPTISAAAGRMPASSGRSSAPPTTREGGGHEHASSSSAATFSRAAARWSSASRSPATSATALAQRRRGRKPLALDRGRCFLAIDAKGAVTVYSGKVDLGTGVRTALRADRGRRARRADRPRRRSSGRHRAHARQGTTWGSLTSRSAACRSATRRRPRAGAARGGRQAARRQTGRAHASPTASSAAGGKRVTYGELIGGKRFSLKLDPQKPRQGQGPEGLQARRQAGAARRHPRQGDRPLHLHAGLPRARHAARPRGAPAGDRRRSSKASTRARSRTSPASSRSCARAISSASSRRANGRAIKAARDSSRRPGRNGKACPSRRSSTSTCARPRSPRTRSPAMSATPPRRWPRTASRSSRATYDFAIHTHGSIGPSCAVAEFKDGKLTSWSASQATHNLRKQLAEMFAHAGRERALHLSRGLRLLRPQRPRGRRRRRRAARQGGRQAGARAMVARRRARLGPEGPADADRPARRAGRRRQRDRLGIGVLHSAADARAASWCR